jgi:hypothetical protein
MVNSQQVAWAGEMFVAAEIYRRGGYAVTFAGNMAGIDILASNIDDSRRISIQVKTKHSGTWQVDGSRDGEQCVEDPGPPHSGSSWTWAGDQPVYFVAPRWWVRNDIWQVHTAYLARYRQEHGHDRDSDHHGIPVRRVEQWRDRWDALGIL